MKTIKQRIEALEKRVNDCEDRLRWIDQLIAPLKIPGGGGSNGGCTCGGSVPGAPHWKTCPLSHPTNTKEEACDNTGLRKKIEEMITEFYFIYCQKDKRPEFKELDEAQNWTDHQNFKASSLVQHVTNQLLALLVK